MLRKRSSKLARARTLSHPRSRRHPHSVFADTKRCSCSMKRNMRTVFGLDMSIRILLVWIDSLRKSEPSWRPSFHQESRSFILQRRHKDRHKALSNFSKNIRGQDIVYTGAFPFTEAALCNLLFKTSAGAQTVVATVPAAKEAAMWTGTPSVSLIIVFERIFRFADVYLVLSQYRLASAAIKHTPQSAKHLLHVSFNSNNGSRTRLTHQDTSHYVRSQAFRESSQALVSSDRDETADCVRI